MKIDRMAMLFSFNCFAAALLALWLGFLLDLPRPYWAVMTVYIISQPLAGAVRSKALYRMIGTFLGAAFAVLTVPVFVNSPLLLSFVLASWVGMCLFISLLDRSPRAYVVMLAGYTAALIGFPTVTHPDQIFNVAVWRVEEIFLGILCATLTHSLIFPRPIGTVLQQRMSAWLKDGDSWALDILRGNDRAHTMAERRHLIAATSEIYLLSVLLPFDTSAMRDTGAVVRAVHQRLLVLIPVLSSIADRVVALGHGISDIQPDLDSVAQWIETGADADAVPSLLQRLTQIKLAEMGSDWQALLGESLVERMRDLILNLGEAHALLLHLKQPGSELTPHLAKAVSTQKVRPLHRDMGLAAISGLSALCSIMLVCIFWIVSGWPEGGVAAALAGAFCAIFAALDDPAPAIVGFGVFSGVGILVAALYQFAILPSIDGFVLLGMVLAPIFMIAGAAMVGRRTGLPALAFLLGLSSALALQETFNTDFADFVNTNAAQYVALWISLLITRSLRSMSVDAAVHRLLVLSWTKLAALAQHERNIDLLDLAAQLIDRLGLVTSKLIASGGSKGIDAEDALTDVRIAMNLATLQQNRADFTPSQSRAVTTMMASVGQHFADLAAGRATAPAPELLTHINHSLDQLVSITDPLKRGNVTALVGLRRNLFPDALAFRAEVST